MKVSHITLNFSLSHSSIFWMVGITVFAEAFLLTEKIFQKSHNLLCFKEYVLS